MYDAASYFVANPINRYAPGDRSGMKFGDDESLAIYNHAIRLLPTGGRTGFRRPSKASSGWRCVSMRRRRKSRRASGRRRVRSV
jgi:hypothetical protein